LLFRISSTLDFVSQDSYGLFGVSKCSRLGLLLIILVLAMFVVAEKAIGAAMGFESIV